MSFFDDLAKNLGKAVEGLTGATQVLNDLKTAGTGKNVLTDLGVAAKIAADVSPVGKVENLANTATAVLGLGEAAMGVNRNYVAPPRPTVVDDQGIPLKKTGFVFGKTSALHLQGVNDDLVRCVAWALTYYSTQDFMVFEGLRTQAQQNLDLANHTTQLKHSMHQDGLAVDLVPIIGGIPKWDWDGCYRIALAMDEAATHLGLAHRITWGGDWSRTLDQYGGSNALDYAAAVQNYKTTHAGNDFLDGPHYQITKA